MGKLFDEVRARLNGKPSTNGHAKAGELPWAIKPVGTPPPAGISAADLVRLELPEPKFAVPGLLCEGLNILGGRPKQGKSWLSLLVGWAVAGGHDLNGRACDGGAVLYLALEDTRRRLRSRLQMLQPALGWEFPPGLEIRTEWPRADQGGLYYLSEWLTDQKGNARLVIIDTLAKFRRPAKAVGNSYAEDYEALSQIKALADLFGSSAMAVTHTRKLPAEDPFEELSGTTAIQGAPDGMIVLDRKRGADEGKLYVTGRDVPEVTIPLTLDRASWRWTLGPAEEGINATGRHVGISKTEQDEDRCEAWLRSFLATYAFPSTELDWAAQWAGFSKDNLWRVRSRIGRQSEKKPRATGELAATNRRPPSVGGEWWNGMGESHLWKLRPADMAVPKFQSSRVPAAPAVVLDSGKTAPESQPSDPPADSANPGTLEQDGPDLWPAVPQSPTSAAGVA